MLFCKKNRDDEGWSEWIEKYPIGKKFKYLDVNMIITHNYQWIAGIGQVKAVRADYVNKHGDIKNVVFDQNEIKNVEMING